MYPRNAASPERIAIGPVVQITDGAVQTTGVSVKVKPQGGSASAGGGTVSYEEGIVGYVPTQAETNYTSFQLIAYKTGCIPAAVTVVTTASSTAGKVDVSHFGGTSVTGRDIGASVLLSNGTGTGQVSLSSGQVTFSNTTIATATNLTNLPSIPANWITATGITNGALTADKFAASSLNGKGDWNVGKTGYSLANGSIITATFGTCVTPETAKTNTLTFTGSDVKATLDGEEVTATGDTGITLAKALEMFAAFVAGKVSRSSGGGVTTLTYKKRDGTTTSFTALCDEDDGDRATTGSLS